MISYELAEEQKIIQSTIAEFAQTELRPETRRLDDDAHIDAGVLEKLWAMEIIQGQAADPESRSPITNAIVLEELGFADAALSLAVASTLGFVGAIVDHGTERQHEELKGFTGGEFQAAAVAVMEPSFGFDVSKIAAKAMRDGDGYRLRGQKAMVPLADRCSHFLVVAESDGVADALIVRRDSPGVSVSAPKATLGLRALEFAEVTFDDTPVPASMRLGESNGADVQQIIAGARIALASIMTGLSRGVLEYVIPYTKDRIVHGTALAKKQFTAFNIADMHMDTEAMRWMTWKAAWAVETKRPATANAQLAYTYASEQTMLIADAGLQMLGGHGFTKGHPMELWYRNARALSVLEGAAGV